MMRPKLKGDTFYLPAADGVYFRNNQTSFKLKGKVIYDWVERLVPYLNGEHTLQEITEGLDPDKQAMVNNLVQILASKQFLKDCSHDLAHTLSSTELQTYASQIAFIDTFSDSAASRFERFRQEQVLLIGSGLTLSALVHACLRSGLRQLTVLTTHECETTTQRHQDYLALLEQDDPQQTLTEMEAPDWDNEAEVLATLQPFDSIVHVSDRPMLARARMLNQLCVTHNKTLIQAVLVQDHAWIGPLVRPEASGCWECAWRRLQGNLTPMQQHFPSYAFQDQVRDPLSRFLALPTAALVANLLAFEIFKSLTGAGLVETTESLVEVDLETLRNERHPFLPHPLCSTCQHPTPRTAELFLDTIHQLEHAEPLDLDLFSKRVAPCFEKRLGLFGSLDEEDFPEPLWSVWKSVVSNPVPQEALYDPPEVMEIGTSFRATRQHAAQRACEIYAASLVDRRLLLSLEAYQGPSIQADRFLSAIPLAEVEEWTWACDLQSGQACLVPASLVYPVLRGLSPLDQAGLGVKSGMSWAEAISRALLNLCHHLTISQLENASKPYPLVDLTAIALEPEGTRQRHLLHWIDEVVTIYDVTGLLQVPTFAICLGDKTVAYSTHLDVTQALRAGLEQAARHWRIPGEQMPVHHGSTVPDLPAALRGDTKIVPQFAAPKDWPERQLWLQQALQKQRWHALVIPLDQDPALRQMQPYIVHVLLARAS